MSFLLKQWLKIQKKRPRKKNRHLKECADAWTDMITIIHPNTSKFVQTLTEDELVLETVNLQNDPFAKQSSYYAKSGQITAENEQNKPPNEKVPERNTLSSKLFMILDSVKADLQEVGEPLAASDNKTYLEESCEFLRNEYYIQKEIPFESEAGNRNLLSENIIHEMNNCNDISLEANNHNEQSEDVICEINNCNGVNLEKHISSSSSSLSNVSLDSTLSSSEFKTEINNTLKHLEDTLSTEKELDKDENCSTNTCAAIKQLNTLTHKKEEKTSPFNVNLSTSKNENLKQIESSSEINFNEALCFKTETLKDILQKISSQLENLIQILDNVSAGGKIININPSQNTTLLRYDPKGNSQNYCKGDGKSDKEIHKLSKLETTNFENEIKTTKELFRHSNEHQQDDIKTDYALESVLKKYNNKLIDHPVCTLKSSSSRSSSETENTFSMLSVLNSSPINNIKFHTDAKFNEFFKKEDSSAEPVMGFRMIPVQLTDNLGREERYLKSSSLGHKLISENVSATDAIESKENMYNTVIECTGAEINSDQTKDYEKRTKLLIENLKKLSWINNEKQILNYVLPGAINKPLDAESSPDTRLLNHASDKFAEVDVKGAGGDFNSNINSLKHLDTSQGSDSKKTQVAEETKQLNTEILQSPLANRWLNVTHISGKNVERSFSVTGCHGIMSIPDNESNITTELLSTTKVKADADKITVEQKTAGRNDENCIIRYQDVSLNYGEQRALEKYQNKFECQKGDAETVAFPHTRFKETGDENNDTTLQSKIGNEAFYGEDYKTDNKSCSSTSLSIWTGNVSPNLSNQKASDTYSRKTPDKQRIHVLNMPLSNKILAQSREIRSPKFGFKFKELNSNFQKYSLKSKR